jgi:hypothetical protein
VPSGSKDIVVFMLDGRLVIEWRRLSAAEKAQVQQRLKENWQKSVLSRKYPTAEFEVLDAAVLATDRPPTASR